jgi:uncharacterized protein (TIGR01777 family)
VGEQRRVLVTGASGLLGRRLLPLLLEDDWAVRGVTRRPARAGLATGVEPVEWDGTRVPAAALAGCEAVVHLAGEPVFRALPSAARRKRMFASRIDSTRALVEALARLSPGERPRCFLCASAVGYYGSRGEELLDESAAPGAGFLADLCVAWEAEARAAADLGICTASLRFGVVLAREGGALAPLARIFDVGLGGRLGGGMQWFPWIQADDAVALIRSALGDPRYAGAVNAVAPNPVRNVDFARALGRALRRPALVPAPAFALRALLGEISGELLDSRRAVPRRALAAGFAFEHETIDSALAAELR